MIFGSAPKDCIWMETGKPILAQATQFAQAQTRVYNVRLAERMAGFEDSLGVSLRITKIKIPTRYIYIYIHTYIICMGILPFYKEPVDVQP